MFSIEVPGLNLQKIYDSYQTSRWIKINNETYVVPYNNVAVKVQQIKNRLLFSCSLSEFCDIWYNYFDMKTDYVWLNFKIGKIDKYLNKCSVKGSGIHILAQDPFEVLITSLITECKYNSSDVIKMFCSKFGNKHKQAFGDAGQIVWFEFPKPEQILENANEVNHCVKNSNEILSICKNIVKDKSSLYEIITKCNDEIAISNVKLFSFNELGIIQKNKIAQKIMIKKYDDEETFANWILEEFCEYAGYVQQLMINFELNKVRQKWG